MDTLPKHSRLLPNFCANSAAHNDVMNHLQEHTYDNFIRYSFEITHLGSICNGIKQDLYWKQSTKILKHLVVNMLSARPLLEPYQNSAYTHSVNFGVGLTAVLAARDIINNNDNTTIFWNIRPGDEVHSAVEFLQLFMDKSCISMRDGSLAVLSFAINTAQLRGRNSKESNNIQLDSLRALTISVWGGKLFSTFRIRPRSCLSVKEVHEVEKLKFANASRQ